MLLDAIDRPGTAPVNGSARPVVSKAEYARLRDCSAAYISKLVRLGKLAAPALTESGQIDVIEANRQLDRAADPARAVAAQARALMTPEEDDSPSFADERRQTEALKRRKLTIEIDEMEGRLVEAARVEQAMMEAGRALRDQLQMSGARIASELATLSDPAQIRIKLDELHRGLLEQMVASFRLNAETRPPESQDAG